jgi:hypothetical protein
MKPLQHARITAHRYGGEWQDWIAIHLKFAELIRGMINMDSPSKRQESGI